MKHLRHTSGHDRGISLIEVLIALLVLSVGLLGLAALQGVVLQSVRAAYHHTQAAQTASELLDFLRASHGIACEQGPQAAPGFGDAIARAQAQLPQGQIEVQHGVDCVMAVAVRWSDAALDEGAWSEYHLASRL